MKNFIILVLLIVLLGAGYYIYTEYMDPGLPQEQMVNVPNNNPETETEWTLYTSSDYGFQVSYPAGWKIASDIMAGEPRISVYKTGEPPYSHHVNATQVSIFPKGLGTEGPVGQNKDTQADITGAAEKNAREYYAQANQTYALVTSFQTHPSIWEDYGYVWASAYLANKQVENTCGANPIEECDPYMNTKVTGTIDTAEFETVKEILKTFKFTN